MRISEDSDAGDDALAEAAPVSTQAISPETPPGPTEGFSLLVDHASEYAIYALSPGGVVSTWNRGAERIKGYRRDEIVGRHFSVFYTPEDQQVGVPGERLREAVRDGHVQDEGWRVRKDGSRFWAHVTITPVWDGSGGLRGFAKLTRDESERRDAEELGRRFALLAERDRVATALTGTLVHQLFGIGLELQGALRLIDNPLAREKVEAAVNESDEAIRRIRTAILDLRSE